MILGTTNSDMTTIHLLGDLVDTPAISACLQNARKALAQIQRISTTASFQNASGISAKCATKKLLDTQIATIVAKRTVGQHLARSLKNAQEICVEGVAQPKQVWTICVHFAHWKSAALNMLVVQQRDLKTDKSEKKEGFATRFPQSVPEQIAIQSATILDFQ